MTMVLDASQRAAVDLICSAPIGVVTGGPGTGKTTCLSFALDRLDAKHMHYELAAPTGKAAKRITETTERSARTIHRLLEYHPDEGFRRNASNPLDADVVIIDESSMIDVELGEALFAAIAPRRTRLILVGDANQLPSVGPGRLFGDLVDDEAVPMVRLQTLHRAALESWVAVNAPKVLEGKKFDLVTRADFRFLEVEAANGILPVVRDLVTRVIPAELVEGDAQVLIPQRPGVAGIHAANRTLQDGLNPRKALDPFLKRGDQELRLADRVIHTKNNYELEVFNGEVGQITFLTNKGLQVDFGDRTVEYTFEQAHALELAYALTVHRSQGSEFPYVIVVCHSAHSFILNRQLLYTAITRARKGVILVGDKKGIARALRQNAARRNTTLIERLHDELEPAYGGEP